MDIKTLTEKEIKVLIKLHKFIIENDEKIFNLKEEKTNTYENVLGRCDMNTQKQILYIKNKLSYNIF